MSNTYSIIIGYMGFMVLMSEYIYSLPIQLRYSVIVPRTERAQMATGGQYGADGQRSRCVVCGFPMRAYRPLKSLYVFFMVLLSLY